MMGNQEDKWGEFVPLTPEPTIETVRRRSLAPTASATSTQGAPKENFPEFVPAVPDVNVAADVGRSALAGVIKGGGDIAGLPGELVAGSRWLAPRAGYYGRRLGEYAGLLSPGAAQAVWEQGRKEEEESATPGERSGKEVTVFGYGVPRTARMQELLEENVPAARYQPQSTLGKYAEEAGRFASGSALPGGAISALGRRGVTATVGALGRGAVSGAAAGLGSEAAGQAAQTTMPNSPMVEAALRISGALVGGGLGTKGVNAAQRFISPSTSAAERLGAAMARDRREGTSLLAFEDVQKNIASGALPIDAMGPHAKKVLEEASRVSQKTSAQAGQLATQVSERADQASQNVSNKITSLFGKNINPAERQDAIKAANQAHIDNLYAISRSHPAANNLWTPELRSLYESAPIKWATDQANMFGSIPNSKIIAPAFDQAGNITRRPNLSYWDTVKQFLDDEISHAFNNSKPTIAGHYRQLKNQLLSELDSAVPAYQKARGVASDVFGGQNALEAGYRALKNVDAFKAQQIKNAFSKMSQNEQQLFASGAAGYLNELVLNPEGVKKVSDILSRPGIAERARVILGPKNFDDIMNQIQLERTLSRAGVSVPGPRDIGHKWSGLLPPAIGGGGSGYLASAVLGSGLPITLDHLLTSGLGTIAALSAKGAYNFTERQIAKRIMDMAGTTDPKKLAKLQNQIQRAPGWASFMGKTAQYGYMGDVPIPFSGERPQRASGGKVSEDDIHEQLVGRLMDLAEKAKKTTQKSTEPLLNAPDEAIVHALKVADNVI